MPVTLTKRMPETGTPAIENTSRSSQTAAIRNRHDFWKAMYSDSDLPNMPVSSSYSGDGRILLPAPVNSSGPAQSRARVVETEPSGA